MTNEPEWMERFDKKFHGALNQIEIMANVHPHDVGKFYSEINSFIQSTIKKEKEKSFREGQNDCCVSKLDCLCDDDGICSLEDCVCPGHYGTHDEWLKSITLSKKQAKAELLSRIEEEVETEKSRLPIFPTDTANGGYRNALEMVKKILSKYKV